MFNTGVMSFQNQSQRRIQTDWASFMSSFLKGELPFPLWENVRLSESIVGSMGAAIRLNKRACIENWAEIEKSFQLLRRKRK